MKRLDGQEPWYWGGINMWKAIVLILFAILCFTMPLILIRLSSNYEQLYGQSRHIEQSWH